MNFVYFSLAVSSKSKAEVNFVVSRVLLQDFTGVPAIVDLGECDATKLSGRGRDCVN